MQVNGTWLLLAVSFLLQGCGYFAEHTAPRKVPTLERTAPAIEADKLFWSTLHSGGYANIQSALEAETAAYLADPADALTAAHVGWLHIWRLSERARLASVPASITDDAVLARRYFEEAVALNPHEARFLGFLASATLADGHINQDESITRRGYFLMRDAIQAWPEFNLFTAGYVMSDLPADSKNFKEALAWQWRDIDVCIGEKLDRKNPQFARYVHLETHEGPKRACWNSWIAPHNFEGFFMNMGDMLVKSGDWQTGARIYAIAKLSTTYAKWPYRDVLEKRITDAPRNGADFRTAASNAPVGSPRMMSATEYSCMACHQE
jgi:hypothetical protein